MSAYTVRLNLYILLCLSSVVLLGLAGKRLNYTRNLPPNDPLNNGKPFHDPIIPEIVVTSILSFLWSIFIIIVMYQRHELLSLRGELLGLVFLLPFYFAGAIGVLQKPQLWGNLFWCHQYWQCRLLTVLVAFAWMNTAIVLVLFTLSVVTALALSDFSYPVHGRYDPHPMREVNAVSPVGDHWQEH
ncbi:hypothetical protein C8Q80DRAFT_478629 [Daedaleopsis nitida]|nr:hypothetical protein C8Q80DRAFT_478629 [Daedaleopsis nitida]